MLAVAEGNPVICSIKLPNLVSFALFIVGIVKCRGFREKEWEKRRDTERKTEIMFWHEPNR